MVRETPKNLVDEAVPITQEELFAANHSVDDLVFCRLTLPGLPAPEADPAKWRDLAKHLMSGIAHLDVVNEALIFQHSKDEEGHSQILFAAIYTRDRSVVPVWFESPNLLLWLEALGKGTNERIARIYSAGNLQAGTAIGRVGDDPTNWLRDNTPSRWKSFTEAAVKQELLDGAVAANERTASIDLEQLATSWGELVRATSSTQNPPVTDEQLASFAAVTGFALPAELEAMLRVCNGAEGAFGVAQMMSLDQILTTWMGWKQIFDEWPLEELQGHSSCPTDEALGIYTTPLWVSFLDERSGNSPAVDLVPGPQGQRRQIIYFGADESHGIRVLASDLGVFIQKQLDFVQAGSFNPSEDGPFYWN